jgi:dTDP-4-amino-4,6-dideoxygalactose transaminase
MTAWRIPLSDVDLGPDEETAVRRVIRSRWLTLGSEVDSFEHEFAAFCGVDGAVGLSSGTAALHLACIALDIGPGTEVVVPTLTFVASAAAIALSGGRPVFCDSIGRDDFTIDPNEVERCITSSTKAVMCMHYGGYPCRMDALLDVCQRRGLYLIEDAAHAPGALWNGEALGTIGDVGCFSFFGNKNLTTGEGGIALARDPAVLERIRLLRSHGMTTSSWDRFRGHASDYDVIALGYNYRPSELPAALGRVQLTKLKRNNERRNEHLDRYRHRLAAAAGVDMPFADRRGAAHLAVALLDRAEWRDPLRASLATAGIQSSVHYPLAHLFGHYRNVYGYGPGDFPVAEDLASRCVTLPLYANMTPQQVEEICDCVELSLERLPSADGEGAPVGTRRAPR